MVARARMCSTPRLAASAKTLTSPKTCRHASSGGRRNSPLCFIESHLEWNYMAGEDAAEFRTTSLTGFATPLLYAGMSMEQISPKVTHRTTLRTPMSTSISTSYSVSLAPKQNLARSLMAGSNNPKRLEVEPVTYIRMQNQTCSGYEHKGEQIELSSVDLAATVLLPSLAAVALISSLVAMLIFFPRMLLMLFSF